MISLNYHDLNLMLMYPCFTLISHHMIMHVHDFYMTFEYEHDYDYGHERDFDMNMIMIMICI